ncbi:recombinase family protein [Enterobacter hormaechei subsp. xiangfangensis]|nr:recombinase family protein [Enterobacter hormaechei subsp. xiangfangensis]
MIPDTVLRHLDTYRNVLVAGNIDRIALVDTLQFVSGELRRGIHFKSLTDSIITSSPMGRFIFHIMSALAEMERELIVERTRAGLAAAREKGRIGGRRPKLTPEQWAQAGRLIANGVDRKQVAIIYDVAVCTLYKKFPAR